MTPPQGQDRARDDRARVYARLAHQAEVRERRRAPGRWARWAGWALCIALVAGVVVSAVRVGL